MRFETKFALVSKAEDSIGKMRETSTYIACIIFY